MRQTATGVSTALQRWWQGDGSVTESLFGVLLSLAYAFSFAMLLVWLNTPLDEPGEWRVFVEAWLLLPPLTLGACLLALSRSVGDRGATLNTLALGQAAVLVFSTALLRNAASAEPAFPSAILRAIACLAPALVAALGLIVPSSGRSLPGRPGPATTLALLVFAVSLLVLPKLPAPSCIALIVAGAGLLAWLREPLGRLVAGRIATRPYRLGIRLIDLAVVAAAAWLLFDPHLHFEAIHANWYLGPSHQILQGATMLVDVASAYGVLPVYFLSGLLAIWPLPLSYPALSAIAWLLAVGQYAIVYALLRHLGITLSHSVLALGVVFVANFIGLDAAMGAFPSLGPMRFGFPYLLLILVAVRGRRPGWTRPCLIGEVVVVAAASLFSIEALFFTLAAYLAILVLEAAFEARDTSGPSKQWLKSALLRLAAAALAIVVAHTVFAGYVYLDASRWPDWPSYFALIGAFTPGGYGLELEAIPALGLWVAISFFYAGSTLACVFVAPRTHGLRKQTALALILGATAMGIAQFSLFVGMSSPYRLASVVIPAVLICAYWVDRLMRSSSIGPAPRRVTAFVGYAAVMLTLLHHDVQLRDWLDHDRPDSLGRGELAVWVDGCNQFPSCLTEPAPYSPLTQAAEVLIDRHVMADENLAVILGGSATTEVLMRSGRRNALALNAVFQDGLVNRNILRILNAPQRLVTGDILVVPDGHVGFTQGGGQLTRRTEKFMRMMFKHVEKEFTLRELSRHNGVVAYRLVAKEMRGGQRASPDRK